MSIVPVATEDAKASAMRAMQSAWLDKFETPLGKSWRPRIEAAETYHRENSFDWDYLRDLFANMVDKVTNGWSTTVAMAYSIITNTAADTYFVNPESWIQAKGGDPTGDVSRAFRDIMNTVHRTAETESIMRRALICDGFAGYGIHWSYFEQVDDVRQEVNAADPFAPPVEVPYAVEQHICGDFGEPWDFRFDPDGRDWKWRDHKYIIRKYRKTIHELLQLPFATDDGKRMLQAWAANRRPQGHAYGDRWGSSTSTTFDPLYTPIDMWEIWCKVTKMVIHIPVGADFDLGSYPWPRAWKMANTFPATFVAFNWEPGDRQRRRGFYPIPLLRLIREPLENINRLESLYAEAATADVIKFLTVKGLLEDDEAERLSNDVTRLIVSVDITKIKEFFPSAINSLGELDLRKIFHQLEAKDRGSSFEYENAIEHEMRMIARTIGSGPQDRFGLPQSKSATEAAGLLDAMDRRARTKSEMAANLYDEISEKFFILLKTMQTLPIDYQASVDGYSEGVWRQWTDLAKVRTMNFAFTHRVGTNVARDPQAETQARNATGQMLLPIYQAAGDMQKVDALTKWMLEPQNFRDLQIFNSQSADLAMELAKMYAMLDPRINPMAAQLASNPQFADRKADLGAKLAQSLLSPAQMQQVALSVQNDVASGKAFAGQGGTATGDIGGSGRWPDRQPFGGQSSPGSLPSEATAGETAYDMGGAPAAGRTNIA